jgi:dTDP-4-dehydrorhamnose reductase
LIQSSSFGLYHLTNAGDCTWYELAKEIFRRAGIEVEVTPITSLQFGAAARRPRYSVLCNDKLISTNIEPPRHWTEALAAYLKDRKTR